MSRASPRKDELAHRSAVLVILVATVVADQLVKGWAWRHAPEARINYGGNAFVGGMISAWYADPVTGALLDFAGFTLLSVAVFVLVRHRLPVMILISGALMTGGWISNLFDRLGMHYWTAPGSVRGAVDFIPLGWLHYNLADVFIASGTVLFLLALGTLASTRATAMESWAPAQPGRLRSRRWLPAIAAAVCLIGVVGFGAINYGGVTAPSIVRGHGHHRDRSHARSMTTRGQSWRWSTVSNQFSARRQASVAACGLKRAPVSLKKA
jgi:lipoprotein signal peptidase